MEYYRPVTLDEALSLKTGDALYIAGGTDLGVMMADAPQSPGALIDLCGIEGLSGIKQEPGGFSIGACTCISEIAASDDLPDVLVQGAAAIGSPQIRNMGTIGGNVCNASPCGDTLTPLVVLDAVFTVKGSGGVREIPAEDFFKGPKKTALDDGEVLSFIKFPLPAAGSRSGFRMIGKRNGQAISQVNMAVLFVTKDGIVNDVRIAAGSVAPVPLRLKKCEALLKGSAVRELASGSIEKNPFLKEIAETAEAEVLPISDVRAGENYRKSLSGALLTDIIFELTSEGARI